MNLRERWEKAAPMARVTFRGARGVEVADVYELAATGHAMWTMAIGRQNFLSRILIPSQHLIFIIGLDPRPSCNVDVRMYLDDGFHLDAVLSTLRPHWAGAWSAMVYYQTMPRRALISQFAIKEIVPVIDDGVEVPDLVVTDEFNSELWPEVGHKR